MESSPSVPEGVVPARLIVGVTGSRVLPPSLDLTARVDEALERIRAGLPQLEATPIELTVLSPLAEGADRVVARAVLEAPGGQLEAVLPLAAADYATDFETPESLAEFEELLGRARRVTELPAGDGRPAAYERAGRYVVDHCDVLVVVWDGRPASGRGGTAEIVAYARVQGRPVYWIHTENEGALMVERAEATNLESFVELDGFNRLPLDPARIDEEAATAAAGLDRSLAQAGLLRERYPGAASFLPTFVRADLAAQRYQRRYVRAGTALYALAAGAVAAAAAGVIYGGGSAGVVFEVLEVVFTLALVWIVWVGNRGRWQRRWIDFRFLAERIRTAIYLHVAGLEAASVRLPRHLSLAYSTKDWMVGAFRSVMDDAPPPRPPHPSELDRVRRFVLEAWIDDQIAFHQRSAERNYRLSRTLVVAGAVMFGITFATAVFLLIFNRVVGEEEFEDLRHALEYLGIALPAIGGSVAAIRGLREYHRNALRSQEMVRHLTEIRDHVQTAQSVPAFHAAVEEAEQTMAHENADWRVLVRFHELEPPA